MRRIAHGLRHSRLTLSSALSLLITLILIFSANAYCADEDPSDDEASSQETVLSEDLNSEDGEVNEAEYPIRPTDRFDRQLTQPESESEKVEKLLGKEYGAFDGDADIDLRGVKLPPELEGIVDPEDLTDDDYRYPVPKAEPLQEGGTPPPPPPEEAPKEDKVRRKTLEEPPVGEEKTEFYEIQSSNSVQFDDVNKVYELDGDVTIQFKDGLLEADFVRIDDKKKEAYARGNVVLTRENTILFGDEAFYNYEEQNFWIKNPGGQTTAQDINGFIYFKGEVAEGSFKKYYIRRGRLTTCEPQQVLEYSLYSKKITVIPKKRIIARHNYLFVREMKVLYVPIVMVYLTEEKRKKVRRSPIQQNYGYNDIEGWFARYAYTYYDKNGLLGVLLLGYLTKKGIEFGLRQDFEVGDLGVGTVRYFYQQDKKAQARYQTFEYTQELDITPSTSGTLGFRTTDSFNIFRNVRTRTRSGNITLQRLGIANTTRLTGSVNSQPDSRLQTANLTFTNSRKFSPELYLDVTQSYTSTKSAGRPAADQEGTFRTDLRYQKVKYNASVKWEERVDFDQDKNRLDDNLRYLNRMPAFNLTLQSSYFSKKPVIAPTTLSVENIIEGQGLPRGRIKTLRTDIQTGAFKTYNRRYGRYQHSFDNRFAFQQTFYDTGDARYVVRPSFRYNFTNNRWLKANFSWAKTEEQGRAALLTDRVLPTNNVDYGVGFFYQDYWNLDLTSGFDYRSNRFRSVTGSLLLTPTEDFDLTSSTSYDIEGKRWADLITTAKLFSPTDRWRSVLEVRSDVVNWKIRTALFSEYYSWRPGWEGSITLVHDRGTTESGLIRYLTLTKRNKCTTMNFVYMNQLNQFYFFVTVNAFPSRPAQLFVIQNALYFNIPTQDIFYGFAQQAIGGGQFTF